MPQASQQKLHFGGSCNAADSSSNNSNVALTANDQEPFVKKQTSFQEEVSPQGIQEEQVINGNISKPTVGDSEDSAIDDSSDWEELAEDCGNAGIDKKTFFQRVASRPNPLSRQSLISTTPRSMAASLSSRTTLRNIIKKEFPTKLRRQLRWERREKLKAVEALYKRKTVTDMGKEDSGRMTTYWNQYFSHGLGEYHSKGW